MFEILPVEQIFWNPWWFHKIQCHATCITYLCIQRIK